MHLETTPCKEELLTGTGTVWYSTLTSRSKMHNIQTYNGLKLTHTRVVCGFVYPPCDADISMHIKKGK